MITTSPYNVAQQFLGTAELKGDKDNPLILAMIDTCWNQPDEHDEIAWCSAFVNFVCKTLNLPRTKSLSAKSWLSVGLPIIDLEHCTADSDIIILNRTDNPMLGHVGFYSGHDKDMVYILGGNQNNQVSVQPFFRSTIAGMREIKA